MQLKVSLAESIYGGNELRSSVCSQLIKRE
jgi:hypothetical protein